MRLIRTKHHAMAPYIPPRLTKQVVYAAKALWGGSADESQQTLFMKWLIVDLCRTYDMAYRPDHLGGDRDTSFSEGKRFVGNEIEKILRMSPGQIDMIGVTKAPMPAPENADNDGEIKNT
jgi:hypothetical protein